MIQITHKVYQAHLEAFMALFGIENLDDVVGIDIDPLSVTVRYKDSPPLNVYHDGRIRFNR